MSKPSPVTFDSTLATVFSHDFEVSSTTLGQVVAQKFAQNPDLPGVIVTDNNHVLGMISRSQFREKIHHSQQKDIYLNSPIQLLLDYIRTPPLFLSQDCTIIDAVKTLLNRPKELIYEPIIVVFEKNKYRLIDVQEILLAQNKLLYLAQAQIEQQQSEIEQSCQLIKIEKKKYKNYLSYYRNQQKDFKNIYENLLNSKQKQWSKSIQEIAQINQEFKSISQLVLTEISRVFPSILSSANSINFNNKYIVDVSQSISRDLTKIHSASNIINDILKQIHYLGVQASILINQAQPSPPGYSKINSEISNMINEIINCNQHINQIANQFNFYIQKLQNIAHNNEEITRSIVSKIQRGEMVIWELEQLLNQDDSNLITLIELFAKNVPSDSSESFKPESELIEITLISENLTLDSNSQNLVHLIEHTLKKQIPSSSV